MFHFPPIAESAAVSGQPVAGEVGSLGGAFINAPGYQKVRNCFAVKWSAS